MKLVAVMVLVLACGSAQARPPFAVLLDDKADASERMVAMIAAAAEKAKVSVFRRWALMRHWHVQNNVSFERLIDPTDSQDKLHQSDWSTQRMSIALCEAIASAPAAAI